LFILSCLGILCYLNIKNNFNFIEYKVTKKFFCSYLNSLVELTNERINHIITRHPELTFEYDKEGDIIYINKCDPYAEQELNRNQKKLKI